MVDPDNAETTDDTPGVCLGAELRRLRVRAGLSLRALGDELHRGYSTISDFERGRRLPGVDVVEQYEDFFGLARGALVAQRERARAAALESPPDGSVDEQLGEVACPYMGLRAFESDDAALFYGRETQIEAVLGRLGEVRFVAVIGASGSGKSSFVRAGLLAGLKAAASNGSAGARVALLTPGEHPVNELASAVSAANGGTVVHAEELRDDPSQLQRATGDAADGGLVIVVDQFEELFTLCHDDAQRRLFVDALIAAWRDPTSPVVVIAALRADFYGRVAAFPELAAAVVAHQTLIGPMSTVDLRRAIELPAANSGLLLQPGLVETILEDLAGEPGALPLLSHALLETCKRRRRLMLTVGGYREAGGVRGAIAQTAERTLQSLPEGDRAVARMIFLSLTDLAEGTEPTRRRVDRAELAAHTPSARSMDGVLGILANARLITLEQDSVVVAHEALIRHWPRLRGWIDADRAGLLIHRRLTAAAREWDTLKREPAALYRGARLATAREWATDHPEKLSTLEHDFLTASDAAEQRELEISKRRTRRLRALASGLAVLTVIVATLAVLAREQRNSAQNERGAAQRQSVKATSLALAASSVEPLRTRPDVSLALAFEAYRESPRPEARAAVTQALVTARRAGLRGALAAKDSQALADITLSPDGEILASASSDKTVRLWNFATRKQLRRLSGHSALVSAVAFSPDGKTLASVSWDKTVRLWDVATGKQLRRLSAHTAPLYAVAFSRDGKTIASGGEDNTVRLWDRSTGKQLARLNGHTRDIWDVAFSPDGKTLASASDDHTVRLWDLATRKQLGRLSGHSGPVMAIAFSPDGKTLASANWDNTVRLWDLATHKQLGRLSGHSGPVMAIAFSPDGKTLASAGSDETVRLWNLATRKQLARFSGHTDPVDAVAFSGDGKTLASASGDRTVRLWDPAARKQHGRLRHTSAVFDVALY